MGSGSAPIADSAFPGGRRSGQGTGTVLYRETAPASLRNLGHTLAEASLIIMNAPERGLPAPRPYPALASLGLSWLKRGRYWIAYDAGIPIIAGVFFETDDIPNWV